LKVKLLLNEETGDILGCDVGFGKLHEFPKEIENLEFANKEESEKLVNSTNNNNNNNSIALDENTNNLREEAKNSSQEKEVVEKKLNLLIKTKKLNLSCQRKKRI